MKRNIMIGDVGVELVGVAPNAVAVDIVTSDKESALRVAKAIISKFPDAEHDQNLKHKHVERTTKAGPVKEDDYRFTLTDNSNRAGKKPLFDDVLSACAELQNGHLGAELERTAFTKIPEIRDRT